MGSLGSITDLLPLVIPILEDILDPKTETDLGEVLAAALPLVQGLSDPEDEDAPDIIGMIGPVLTNILAGKDGQGSDVAAILRPLVTLVAPLIGPVLGPLVGPALTASSNPNRGPGNNVDRQRIVNNPPSRRPHSNLPQNLPPGAHPRPPSYVQHRPQGPYHAGTSYAATEGGSSYLPYGTNAVPASSANPIAVIGGAIKDVLGAGIQVVSSVINAAFGIIGGSSGGGDDPKPVYGPPAQGYAQGR
ncbi:uncharacterized protein [Venturia canescens]|uniref:uncharacterized protein n=1 Tax=Venturia canescens TaxID=32260 RepID=UPI001C9C1CF4|nr:uncharacterized protein LOC122416799 [Venturia canescens]